MSTITDETALFNFVSTIQWTGRYSGSQGTVDMASNFSTLTTNYVPVATTVAFDTNAPLTHGFNTYFKMQGFNNATGQYEVWFSTTTPLLVPPSGHTLSNIQVVLTWIDR